MSNPQDDRSDQPPDVEVIPIGRVIPDSANARIHPSNNQEAIRRSIKQFGAGRSIVLDREGVVRAGNGTVEAAKEVGIEQILVVRPKPGQLVAVQRDDWSATEATAYAIADNRSGDLARFDNDVLTKQLEALQADGMDIEDVGFTQKDLNKLLKDLGKAEAAAEEPEAEDYEAKFQLVIECQSEDQQQELFEELTGRDIKVRVLSL
jgi:ParB-like chromosome segregation protein Spo0J